ncbi:MAG: YggS family pyridoxal phosphate-dependent enzyme [Treponema sp.]|jgi:pyridoxal phosphate enzyme (YggS family)|nr:YggS family pyridoxal phosphate-dependent enzyme [Treponema sp.]
MTIAERIEDIRNRIETAAAASGRNPGDVRLMAVSKFHGAEKVEAACKAGLSLFGENRVQEAGEKFLLLREKYPLELHLIGSLQRNKAKTAAALFDCVQSVDRDGLVTTLGTTAGQDGRKKPLQILLEMHTGEESKSGYPDTDALCAAVDLALSFPGLEVSGLMTMAPFTKNIPVIRKSFRTLAAARDTLSSRFPELRLSCLSMGMSNDFETAVEEGSTLVRIGTAIFGGRPA